MGSLTKEHLPDDMIFRIKLLYMSGRKSSEIGEMVELSAQKVRGIIVSMKWPEERARLRKKAEEAINVEVADLAYRAQEFETTMLDDCERRIKQAMELTDNAYEDAKLTGDIRNYTQGINAISKITEIHRKYSKKDETGEDSAKSRKLRADRSAFDPLENIIPKSVDSVVDI